MRARKKRAPSLPPAATVVVIQSGAGLEVQVHGLKLGDVETVADWLQALWAKRDEAVPDLNPVAGGSVSAEEPSEYLDRHSKRVGFTIRR